MAYIDRTTGNRRTGTIVAVAALHGAAIYALVTGLGVDFVKETITRIEAYNIPETKPEPPPEPQVTQERTERPQDFTAPEEDIRLPRERNIVVVRREDDLVIPDVPYTPKEPEFEFTPPTPREPPKPAFDPVSAAPRGKPGAWFGPNDYPTRDIREGNEGTVQFRVAIDARGKVADCIVTRSSGHSRLDDATCAVVKKRGRFSAAKDDTGALVAGSYTSSVKWEIPR
ncbi:MAG: TonB family protein [Sphingomonadaceae bacterium]